MSVTSATVDTNTLPPESRSDLPTLSNDLIATTGELKISNQSPLYQRLAQLRNEVKKRQLPQEEPDISTIFQPPLEFASDQQIPVVDLPLPGDTIVYHPPELPGFATQTSPLGTLDFSHANTDPTDFVYPTGEKTDPGAIALLPATQSSQETIQGVILPNQFYLKREEGVGTSSETSNKETTIARIQEGMQPVSLNPAVDPERQLMSPEMAASVNDWQERVRSIITSFTNAIKIFHGMLDQKADFGNSQESKLWGSRVS